MPKGALADTLFGTIEPDIAEYRIGQLRKAWYILAGWQAVAQTILMLSHHTYFR